MGARGRLTLWWLVLVCIAVPGVAGAQGNVAIDLSTVTISFPAPGVAEFDAGWIEYGELVVTVTSRPSNRPWQLTIRALDFDMGAGKPISDLAWRHAASGDWTQLASSDAVVLEGSGDQDVTLSFRLRLDWATDGPGVYSADVDFTVLRL